MVKKAVIFDCFGVLVMSGRSLLYHDFQELSEEIRDLELSSDYGMISRDEFDQSVADLTGLTAADVRKKYWDVNTRNEAAIDWAKKLKESGIYKVCLLSNIGKGWMDDFLPRAELSSIFDEVILSCDVGLRKPDSAIFELTANKLGVNPDECVMIDDVLENVDASERVGMDGILFGTTNQAMADFETLIRNLGNA